mmetsp:Transcript_68346/g.146235  ORF Transcript_68346/g.146235 Transcript_68346/m.146235 type:complete len:214 (-) Transcript_68346:1522-2163(-)
MGRSGTWCGAGRCNCRATEHFRALRCADPRKRRLGARSSRGLGRGVGAGERPQRRWRGVVAGGSQRWGRGQGGPGNGPHVVALQADPGRDRAGLRLFVADFRVAKVGAGIVGSPGCHASGLGAGEAAVAGGGDGVAGAQCRGATGLLRGPSSHSGGGRATASPQGQSRAGGRQERGAVSRCGQGSAATEVAIGAWDRLESGRPERPKEVAKVF